MEHISEREVDGRALRIELNCDVLRGCADSATRKKCREESDRGQERTAYPTSTKGPGVSAHRVTQSADPIPG
jgi:hypothetical protein